MEGNFRLRYTYVYRKLPILFVGSFALGAFLEAVMVKSGYYTITGARAGQRGAEQFHLRELAEQHRMVQELLRQRRSRLRIDD